LQELGAVMSSIVVDGHKATNAYFKYPASEKVQEVYEELERLSWDLRVVQGTASLDFPINLCKEVGGLAESWVNGLSWREICRDTSLDQGDICRILRRTVEILRQIPQAIGISAELATCAANAADLMDRFPVAELDVQTGEIKDTSGVGFGLTSVAISRTGDEDGSVIEEVMVEDDELVEDESGGIRNNILGDDDDDILPSRSYDLNASSDQEFIENLTKLTQSKLRNSKSESLKYYSSSSYRRGKISTISKEDGGVEEVEVEEEDEINLDELLGITETSTVKYPKETSKGSSAPKNSFPTRSDKKKRQNFADRDDVKNIFKEKFHSDEEGN
jgi:hypothetical protein